MVVERIYCKEETAILAFRKRFAFSLINNEYLKEEQRQNSRSTRLRGLTEHRLTSLPPFRTFSRSGNLIPCKTKYIQLHCSNRCARVRTYCPCSPGVILCRNCFVGHCLEVDQQQKLQPRSSVHGTQKTIGQNCTV